jgi:hypothetical protein
MYIKSYKIFESKNIDIDSIKDSINDIFAELIDIGYSTEVDIEAHDFSAISNSIDKESFKFKFSLVKHNDRKNDTIDFPVLEAKQYILRMEDYLKSINFWNNDLFLFTLPKIYKSWEGFKKGESVSIWMREVYVFRLEFWVHL